MAQDSLALLSDLIVGLVLGLVGGGVDVYVAVRGFANVLRARGLASLATNGQPRGCVFQS